MRIVSDWHIHSQHSCDGACMTVAAKGRGSFHIDVSVESLRRTALGTLRAGSPVNLERSLALADRLGGHLVQGHVDGVGRVIAIEPEANGWGSKLPTRSLGVAS